MTTEFDRTPKSGWTILPVISLTTFAVIAGLVWSITLAAGDRAPRMRKGEAPASVAQEQWRESSTGAPSRDGSGSFELMPHTPQRSNLFHALHIVAWSLGNVVVLTLWCGFFTLQPNTAAVLMLFGAYKGTTRKSGFHWANPFYTKVKVSLRARNQITDKLKVNDQRGNPIEIAAVIVWRVHDTARAVFDVDDYTHYLTVQSESAVRHLASSYPYDSHTENELSLRGSMDEIARTLQEELEERLAKAGVVVEEARLSHLAYAPEIAGAMLRRQQAEAIVAARRRIVDGAVGMVQMALEHIDKEKIAELDAERKAAMISNLLVVLCSEQAAQPVVNAGTLYH